MPIEFLCQHCATKLRVPDSAAGKQARCPKCERIWPVPEEAPIVARPTAGEQGPRDERRPISPEGPAESREVEPRMDWWRAEGEGFRDSSKPLPRAVDDENPYRSPLEFEVGDRRGPLTRGLVYGGRGMADRIPASRGLRFGGALLDAFLHGVGFLPGVAIAGFSGLRGSEAEDLMFAIGALGMFAVAIANWVLIAVQGQSLAKWMLDMEIINVYNGRRAGFVDGVLLRILVIGLINNLCGLFALLDAIWIFNRDMRCLHDHIASTHVVMKNASTRHDSRDRSG